MLKYALLSLWKKMTGAQPNHRLSELSGRSEKSPHLRHYSAQSATQKLGEQGEYIARAYLEQAGLRFIDGNLASNLGEIDLIMLDNDVLVFVEVKVRRSEAFGGAMAAITPTKLKRLRQSIALYRQHHPKRAQMDCRIDAVVIQGVGAHRNIEWLKNITID